MRIDDVIAGLEFALDGADVVIGVLSLLDR
jgi:hypothetical protein